MSDLRNSYPSLTIGDIRNDSQITNRPGVIQVLMRGLLPNANNITPQTIWDGGGNYVYLNSNTELFLSSSDAGDVGQSIRIMYLDENYNLFTVFGTLNGQSQVSVGIDYFRPMEIVCVAGQLSGTVYLAESDTLVGGVPQTASKIKSIIPTLSTFGETGQYLSDHASHNGFFTVPANYELHLKRVLASSTGAEGNVTYRIKSPTGPWLNRNPLPITGNRIDEVFSPALILPEKFEIQARCLGGINNLVTTRMQGVLVPTNM